MISFLTLIDIISISPSSDWQFAWSPPTSIAITTISRCYWYNPLFDLGWYDLRSPSRDWYCSCSPPNSLWLIWCCAQPRLMWSWVLLTALDMISSRDWQNLAFDLDLYDLWYSIAPVDIPWSIVSCLDLKQPPRLIWSRVKSAIDLILCWPASIYPGLELKQPPWLIWSRVNSTNDMILRWPTAIISDLQLKQPP